MKRRKFIKNIGAGALTPLAFNGVPLRLLGAENVLNKMAVQSTNDHVLIILQLIGGNDALNTFVPINDYDQYAQLRPNIAIPKEGSRAYIPLDSTVESAAQVGLHPDMMDFKDLYDSGKAAVFQSVGYENMSGSHFRGTDIIFQGIEGGGDDQDSGWLGRYVGSSVRPSVFPNDFPSEENPHPLALETGAGVSSLLLHPGSVPTSLSLGQDPSDLGATIRRLSGFGEGDDLATRGKAPDFLNGTFYNDELNAILSLENQTEVYLQRIADIYNNSAATSVEYPTEYPFETSQRKENPLSEQLQLVARLLGGGIRTKVFRVTIGGFDTHGNQVSETDATTGIHAALLYHVCSAMKAFQQDLANRGLEDRVLTATISEFGRRIPSNGSRGTAHGRGGAVMMFGKNLNPGIYGNTPNLNQDNIEYQLDYRQVFANLLHEWMGVSQEILANEIFFRDFIAGASPLGGDFEPLDIVANNTVTSTEHLQSNYHIKAIYPNPANRYTQIEVFVNNHQQISVELLTLSGKVVARTGRKVPPGSHAFMFVTSKIQPGFYLIKVKSERMDETKRLLIRH